MEDGIPPKVPRQRKSLAARVEAETAAARAKQAAAAAKSRQAAAARKQAAAARAEQADAAARDEQEAAEQAAEEATAARAQQDAAAARAEEEAAAEAAVEAAAEPEEPTPVIAGVLDPIDLAPFEPEAEPTHLPVLIPLEGRSLRAETCPFFRSIDPDGGLERPFEYADPANRCAAFGEPRPQSTRQQELVCLQSAHINCPRYLRGSLVAADPLEAKVRVRTKPALPRATVLASAVLVVSAVVSVGFVLARGGIDLPIAAVATPSPAPSATQVALATPTLVPSPLLTPAPTPSPLPSPMPSASPVPSPTPSPTPVATPAPTPTPTPRPTLTSTRYRLLDPCPDRPKCWIYTVRSGDNVYSIARYFGHSLNTLYSWNPGLEGSPLKAGREIRMPPPTR